MEEEKENMERWTCGSGVRWSDWEDARGVRAEDYKARCVQLTRELELLRDRIRDLELRRDEDTHALRRQLERKAPRCSLMLTAE